MFQNSPNPFNPVTNLEFDIPELGFVSMKIYNVLGTEIIKLVNDNLNTGKYKFQFDGAELMSGVYFYTLIFKGKIIETKSMILLK